MADTDTNIIPALGAAGSFEASTPFDTVVDPSVYYTVGSVSTVAQLQASGINIYEKMFKPIGVSEADYPTILQRVKDVDGGVVVLTAKGKSSVYVLSTYFKSFPLVDGVVYDHLCIVLNLGAVPPTLVDTINTTLDHLKNYVSSHVGVDATALVGTVPTRSFISKEQAEIFESTRQNKISGTTNDVTQIAGYEETITKQAAYIAQLEAQLKAKVSGG